MKGRQVEDVILGQRNPPIKGERRIDLSEFIVVRRDPRLHAGQSLPTQRLCFKMVSRVIVIGIQEWAMRCQLQVLVPFDEAGLDRES